MKRTAEIVRFEGGWQVSMSSDKEVIHTMYCHDTVMEHCEIAMMEAMLISRIWILGGVAVTPETVDFFRLFALRNRLHESVYSRGEHGSESTQRLCEQRGGQRS